jgi:type II secretory ATPase GspE/PulE/Tfp pilus assembly ATPase PilB-like protein
MTAPTVLGERVTARILVKPNEIIQIDRLQFSTEQLAALRRLTSRPSGFVAVSGRVGSGKTVTLYALLLDLHQNPNRARSNIMTVEEPVEYVVDGVSQIRVNRSAGLTYAAALRAVQRSDLDVVLVADLPDHETAELALEMAATGHLVLAQLQAKNALAVLTRLREIGVDVYLIAQTLAGVLCQRLARRVCTDCMEEYEPSPASLQRLGLTPADGPFRRGAGCEACRKTGYRRRVALYEILEVDDDLRQLIAADASVSELWQATFARTGGSMWDDAREKVREGLTTVEEALRVLFDYSPPRAEGQAP